MSDYINGGANFDEKNNFRIKLEEAKTYESKINMYDSSKPQPAYMKHLSIPNLSNMAFPTTGITNIVYPSTTSKIKISYAGTDYENVQLDEESNHV